MLSMVVDTIKKRLPISYYQKFFWLEWKLDPNSPKYNTSLVYRITGNLKEEALQQALDIYIREFHQAARHYFHEAGGIVEQVVEEDLEVCLEKEFLSSSLISNEKQNSSEEVLSKEIEAFIEKYCHCSFNLVESPPFKFGLLKVTEEDHVLVLSFHHIVTDAFTAVFLVQTLSDLYNHYACNAPMPQALLESFSECILREKEFYTLAQREADLSYWKDKLANKSLAVPFLPNTSLQSSLEKQIISSYYFSVDVVITKLLKQLALREGTTLFIVLSSVFAVLLYRYTQQKNICLSYNVNVRPIDFKKLPGCFVNMVPLVVTLEGEISFQELIRHLTLERKESRSHQRCSFVNILQFLKEESVVKTNDHLNVGIVESLLNVEPLKMNGLNVKSFPIKNQEGNDLLLCYQENDKLEFRLDYQKKLFKESFIQQMARHFISILEMCLSNSQQKIAHFPLLSDREKQVILMDWNNTEKFFPKDKTIHQLFEEQVINTPNGIAVRDEDQTLTFDALNRKSNQLARAIRDTLSSKNTEKSLQIKQPVIAICADRCLELVVGILGVLKSGACYLPIDPTDTEFRIQTMLNDAKVDLVLTLKQNIKEKPVLRRIEKLILLDSDWKFISKLPDSNLSVPCCSTDLSYVIYTSGTTGVPKGVMIEHINVVNIILDIKDRFKITEQDKVFNLSSMAFDVYGLELFLALLSGACHVLCSSIIMQEPKKIVDRIIKANSTLVIASPSLWSVLLKFLKKKKRNFTIFSTAEPLSCSLARKLKSISNEVWNLYGPTETTIVSSLEKLENRTPGIGRSFANTKLYVLDEHLNPVPVGAIGELYISGVGVTRGYLNDSKLTETKFIRNPFHENCESLMYKTGDYVQWREDGTLEYLGRIDRQVKIRGFRVELSEIESVLFSHPKVIDCVVDFCNEEGQSHLVAFYVLKKTKIFNLFSEAESFDVGELSNYLKKHLPSQMQPTAFVKLKEIPRTVTRKVNKLKLPKPDASDFCHGQKFIRPYDTLELKLKEIWLEILKLPRVGVFDDFSLVGGHSLASIYLVSRINEVFNVHFPVAWISKYRTIRMQADQIRKEGKIQSIYNPIVQFNVSKLGSTGNPLRPRSYKRDGFLERQGPSNEETPLVFIHSTLAGAEVYDEIANHFNKDISFYAIDSYNLNSGKAYLDSIEDLALEYINYLRQIKPRGPYLLGGWSFGGMIAFEMAQQLTKMGEVVNKIYLVDGHIFRRDYVERLYNVVEAEDLIGAVSRDWMEYLENLPKKYLDKIFASLQNDIKMIMQYTIQPYPGSVMLLRSTKLKSSKFLKLYKIFTSAMNNSWKPFVKNLEIKFIYSDHFNLIEGEKVQEVAEIIEKDIYKLRENVNKREPLIVID